MLNDDIITAALYERVSTLEQAIEGYSLSAQNDKLENHAHYKGYSIYDRYIDDGYSGSSLNRPGIQRLINDIKSGKINVVLIYKLDRLSRRVKDVLELVELFELYKVTLYSLTENIDLSSAFGRAALKMAATFSELERENIIERTTMGRVAKANKGLYSCHGRPPFGYRFDKAAKTFYIDENEAEMVQKIFELYVNGNSLRRIYEYCKKHFRHEYFSNEMCCKQIIHRHVYAGYMDWKGQLIATKNIEPIIPLNVFLQAQEKLRDNLTKHSHDNSPYLLTGLLVCAKCGGRYVGKRRNHYKVVDGIRSLHYSYRTYVCSSRLNKNKKSENYCRNTIINADELDNYIIECINNLNIIGADDEENDAGVIDDLMNDNKLLNVKKEKLLDLYIDNIIDKDTFQKRTESIERKIDANNAIIENEKLKLSSPSTNIIDYIEDKQSEFAESPRADQQKLIGLLIKQIIIDDNEIRINWRVNFTI